MLSGESCFFAHCMRSFSPSCQTSLHEFFPMRPSQKNISTLSQLHPFLLSFLQWRHFAVASLLCGCPSAAVSARHSIHSALDPAGGHWYEAHLYASGHHLSCHLRTLLTAEEHSNSPPHTHSLETLYDGPASHALHCAVSGCFALLRPHKINNPETTCGFTYGK